MNNETEKNYQLFKAMNTKVIFPKVERQPETVEQKEKREFLNFLFDKFLNDTEIGRIPAEYNRSSVYIDFVQFVQSKSETIENNQKYIEVATIETLINYLTDASWSEFLKCTYKPTKVNKNTEIVYLKKPIRNRIAENIIASIGKISIPAPEPIPTKLIKSLTENQQIYLFNKLTENSLFFSTETDFKSFCFVFGNSIKPDDFIPLQWMQNRQLLRELITQVKHPDIKISTNLYSLPAFFVDKKGNIISELPTNTPKGKDLSFIILKITENLRQNK